jgi:parallel beta-helix repeat protein
MKSPRFLRLLCLLLILYFIQSFFLNEMNIFAQTQISAGDVSGSWTKANSPYYINGNISVPDGLTLQIEPGVQVIFTGHYELDIKGQLLAIGSKTDTISFAAQNTSIGWNGLRFVLTSSTNDTSKIIYCKIQYAIMSGMATGAIYLEYFNKLVIANCLISNNITYADNSGGGAGIGLNVSSPIIESNMISYNIASGCHGGGLCIISSSPIIKNNIISKNEASAGSGFLVYFGNPVFINNTIVNNIADIPFTVNCHGGAMCIISSSPVFFNNIIYGNEAAIGSQINLQDGAEPDYLYCDIEFGIFDFSRDILPNGSYSGTYVSNIDRNPLFLNTISDDYRLSNNSSCIGVGGDSINIESHSYYSPYVDFYGNPRPTPLGSHPDIGAIENELRSPLTETERTIKKIPDSIQLFQNFPNPFNPNTTISYSVPKECFVTIKVYDVIGREIKTLVNEEKIAGNYSAQFNGTGLSGGIYFYRMQAGDFVQTKKLVLLK